MAAFRTFTDKLFASEIVRTKRNQQLINKSKIFLKIVQSLVEYQLGKSDVLIRIIS